MAFLKKLKMGDTMILIYIENKELSGKIATYLDLMKIKYTTNPDMEVSYAIIAEINKKTMNIMNKTKTIFISYLEEDKIYEKFLKNNKTSKIYQNKILNVFNKCTKVVVSMPYFKKLVNTSNIIVIPKEVAKLNFVKTKKGKKVIFYDSNYTNLDFIYEIAMKYPKLTFYYIGYKNNLTLKEKSILNKIPNNVIQVKNWNYLSYIDLVKEAFLVIHNDKDLIYAQISILLGKNLLVKDIPYYEDYFIPSKDCYFYNDLKSLSLKIDKIMNRRLSSLGENAYEKLAKIDCKYVAMKYSILLI